MTLQRFSNSERLGGQRGGGMPSNSMKIPLCTPVVSVT